jgi:hypothetical protein
MQDINEMSDADHAAWLAQAGGGIDATSPTEHNLINTFSEVLREESPAAKAQLLIDVANLCLAMADATLGVQGCASTCLEITKH